MCLDLINKEGKVVTINPRATPSEIKRAAMRHVHIAHADMIVYKGLDYRYPCWYDKKGKKGYYSPHKNYEYHLGCEYYQDDTEDKFTFDIASGWSHEPTRNVIINRGLHVCSTISRAKRHAITVCEFIIPKGSTYFVGQYDEIVCDRYIFKRRL